LSGDSFAVLETGSSSEIFNIRREVNCFLPDSVHVDAFRLRRHRVSEDDREGDPSRRDVGCERSFGETVGRRDEEGEEFFLRNLLGVEAKKQRRDSLAESECWQEEEKD
jgi:hypothetical protein